MAYKLVCLILLGCVASIHIVRGYTNAKLEVKDEDCLKTPCSCCLNPNTCNNGTCDGQCKDGIFGGRCLTYCPKNCVACKDPYNPTDNQLLWGKANCTSCQAGYFSTSEYFQCQLNCNSSCETCTSATDCTSCKTGQFLSGKHCFPCPTYCDSCTSAVECIQCKDKYYKSANVIGNICIACSNGCLNGTCDSESGLCTCKDEYAGDKCDRCIDGKYDMASNCQNPCNPSCVTCVSRNNCTSCVDKYILQGSTCQSCKTGCAQCLTPDSCQRCEHGYYMSVSGIECLQCFTGCSSQCNALNGSCPCRTGFAGERCDQCAPHFQTYPQCNQCKVGFHGTDCDLVCPTNCKDNVCEKDSGRCTDGCNGNVNGDNCTICNDGWYSTKCNAKCPENCRSTCDQSTGYCHGCTGNFTGDTCDACINGKHGRDCNVTCPFNCYNSTCHRYSGHCKSCIPKFSGDRCCLEGPNCQSCSSESVCSECAQGKYGERCEQGCPEICARKICDKVNGTCITCVDGFTGDNCTLASITTGPGPGIPVAAVAGGVVGGIVAIIVCIVLLIFFKRRFGHTNKNTNFKAHTDSLTTERLYANDAAVTEDFNAHDPVTYTNHPVTNTYETVTDMEPPSLGASWKKIKERPSTTERPNATNKLDESLKSDKASRLDTSAKPDKPVKPEIPVKTSKPAIKASKTPKPHVAIINNGPGDESLEDEDDNDYYNSDASAEKGIHVSELASYVDKEDSDFFNTEFAKLPKGLVKSTDAALLDQNLGKNRYNAIYPYDETRVVLAGPGSNFINACYIEGYRKKRRYIASLGPIAKATEGFKTFWRMVWQEKTEKIVMVTNLMESGGMKCEQYWPDKNVTLTYGDVKVSCHSEDVYAEYTVRSFTVRKKKEQRSLHHIHYTAWPDKGVPDDVTSLVEFRNKVNSTKTPLRGPIIVHCSAGVGRTGTYIALDILTLKGERMGFVDIFECVKKLRQQRTCMVQTVEQYEYLHRALVHTLTFKSEAIPADHFMAYTSSLPDDIFDRLSHCTEKISTEEMEAIDRNKAYSGYNRPGADIPGDNNRPRLYYGRTTEDNDYINALFVNSFKRKNQFILAQTPLPNTLDDFLTLVVQENCCCIVSMDAADLVDKTIGTYLPPDNQTLTTDSYEVRIKKLDSNHIYSQRTFTITSKNTSSTVTVQHFRCINWSAKDKTPKSPSDFFTFVKQIQKVADETTQFSPIIMHCRTGSERSALPCVVLSLLQKIEIEHEVSVINTVRQVKVRRPKSIPNKEQFKFCHQCVSAYLQTFDIYSNFS